MALLECAEQNVLTQHNYNTFGNFIKLYDAYTKSGETDLRDFYRLYSPPITSEHHTCVGLGLELMSRLFLLEDKFPGLIERIHLVSCEEAIEDIPGYVTEEPNPLDSEKEHVLVALNLRINGRTGIMLLDPGYHIGRVITVMKDGIYPHTGWFTQVEDPTCHKEYNYSCPREDGYVLWKIRENRPKNEEKVTENLIYVGLPYMAPVDVTERRNLVYNFKCIVSRTAKGSLVAGLYANYVSPVTESFTIFYQHNGVTVREKISFSCFNGEKGLNDRQEEMLAVCGEQLRMEYGDLITMIKKLGQIAQDADFLQQILSINNEIYNMGQV